MTLILTTFVWRLKVRLIEIRNTSGWCLGIRGLLVSSSKAQLRNPSCERSKKERSARKISRCARNDDMGLFHAAQEEFLAHLVMMPSANARRLVTSHWFPFRHLYPAIKTFYSIFLALARQIFLAAAILRKCKSWERGQGRSEIA